MTWIILGTVERYTVRNRAEAESGKCRTSRANIELPDAATPMPFVRNITYEDVDHDRADFPEPEILTRLRQMSDSMRIIGQDPKGDVGVSHMLKGTDPPQLAIAGKATNKSAKFYPCVELQFTLLNRGPGDQYVQAGMSSVALHRLRAHETRAFTQKIGAADAVTLASVGGCQ